LRARGRTKLVLFLFRLWIGGGLGRFPRLRALAGLPQKLANSDANYEQRSLRMNRL